MKILLLRHGESSSINLSEEELCPQDHANALTARGIKQLELLAPRIAELLVAPRVFASDMRRALESGRIIARGLNANVVTWPELREIWEIPANVTMADVKRTYQKFWSDFYCGDVHDAMVTRVRSQGDALRARIVQEFREDSDMVLVSHGGIIEILLSKLLGEYARPGYSIEVGLETGAFHLLDLVLDKGRISYLRLLRANCAIP
jgi:broad specificity phosphatase PhoE